MTHVVADLLRRRARAALLVACSLALWAVGPAAADESTATPGKPPAADMPSTFMRDGKLDVKAAVDYFEDLYRSDSSISVAELIVTRPRRTRKLRLKSWTLGDERALIVIQAPPRDKGSATLKVENNLWNYMPRIRRTIRIPPSMMLASWMGSDFTNDDLVRESSYTEDYAYSLVGYSEDPPGWLVRFDAKPDVVGLWSRFDVVLSEDGTVPVQASYYDRRGDLARIMDWTDVRVFDGRRVPAHMTLVPVDEDKEGHITELIYHDIRFNVDVPESTFSLSRLERTN